MAGGQVQNNAVLRNPNKDKLVLYGHVSIRGFIWLVF